MGRRTRLPTLGGGTPTSVTQGLFGRRPGHPRPFRPKAGHSRPAAKPQAFFLLAGPRRAQNPGHPRPPRLNSSVTQGLFKFRDRGHPRPQGPVDPPGLARKSLHVVFCYMMRLPTTNAGNPQTLSRHSLLESLIAVLLSPVLLDVANNTTKMVKNWCSKFVATCMAAPLALAGGIFACIMLSLNLVCNKAV